MLSGKWTFRSFRNETKLLGEDPSSISELVLMEGVLDLEADGASHFHGALGLRDGRAITVEGKVDVAGSRALVTFRMGEIPGSGSEGRSHEGEGALVPAASGAGTALLVGTLRQVDGETTGFIAVRHPRHPPPRTARRSLLTAGL